VESLRPEIFEGIRKGLKHSVVVENLKRFIELRNRLDAKTRIGIRFIESATNRSEKDEFMAYWEPFIDINGRGDCFSIDHIHNWGYGDPNIFHGSSPCVHTRALTILSDGTVVFCCIDHDGVYQLGNARKQSLIDIYEGQEALRLRAIQDAGQRHTLKMCSTCDLPEVWSGNPLNLYDEFVAADWISVPTKIS
jgi:MoaA/NifB/PqqE/SkfB family radical SAM enzyme